MSWPMGTIGQCAPFVFNPSDWYYSMTGRKYMLIFNNYEFQDTIYFCGKPATLHGTEFDVRGLGGVFTKFGFDVRVYVNKEYDEILETVSELSRQNHVDTSCVCLAVVSHGGEGGRIAAADQPYQIGELLRELQYGDAGLVGIPKILLVQACRGGKHDFGRVQLDSHSSKGLVLPTHADTLVFYSTVEDYLSWGHMDGSWLFKELCHVLESAHTKLDLLQMTTVVAGLVARNYETYVSGRRDLGKVKQMPEVHSTLTKLLRFMISA